MAYFIQINDWMVQKLSSDSVTLSDFGTPPTGVVSRGRGNTLLPESHRVFQPALGPGVYRQADTVGSPQNCS